MMHSSSAAPETRSSITARNLSFRYAASGAGLHNISFSLNPGRTMLITGPSGCGKSTLLRLINGLIPHFDEGELHGEILLNSPGLASTNGVASINPAKVPLHRSAEFSATVFQNPRRQFFTDTVITELAFALENAGIDPGRIRNRIDEVAHTVGIEDLLRRSLGELSGGQLQQVACACALMPNTGLILFDEPTASLDSEAIATLRKLLQLLRRLGKTIIIAEHRIAPLRGLVDDVVVIDNGEISASLSAEEFFAVSEQQRQAWGLRSLTPVPLPPIPRLHNLSAPETAPARGLALDNIAFSRKSPAGFRRGVLRGVQQGSRRDERRILDIDHLVFPAGEITAVIGPNGTGKTTLGRLICGLEKPQRGGTIQLKGKRLSATERNRRCQMVMQDVGRQLFSETVAGEIELGAKEPPPTQSLLEQMDLAGLDKRHPRSLSGGQRQRLVIAAAKAQNADVYVFDEPTSGVPWRHLKSIAQRLEELAAAGAVVIVITHDNELIEAAATRILDLSPFSPHLAFH